MVRTLSGGEQKRLALEALLRGPDEVLLLDEPDNYLDVPGKRWLEERLRETPKTVLFVSHDRELLARTADRVVTVEARSTWVHGGGFATYHAAAREARLERLDELHRRWDEEHDRLKELVRTLQQQAKISPDMASPLPGHADPAGASSRRPGRRRSAPVEQQVAMRLRGGRTGVRALTCVGLELTGLMQPFDLEVFFGERVAVLGSNGSGKSHFLRLLAGDAGRAHRRLEARRAGACRGCSRRRTSGPTSPAGRWSTSSGAATGAAGLDRGRAIGALRRYGLHEQADERFDVLSGGQQARLQMLLLELSGTTMLLLDEPTDNLDLVSAEALQQALAAYEGTVLAVTHDRWFARSFDRFLVFRDDGAVVESAEPVWDVSRVDRAR